MKIKLLSCLLLCLLVLALPLSAAPPKGQAGPNNALQVDNTQIIDANRIMMFVTNHGNFGRDLAGYFGYDYGTWFPYSDTASIRNNTNEAAIHTPLYAAGLWVGAVDSVTGQTRIAIAEYSDEYVPGPMSGGTFETDRPEFKVYKLYKDSLGANPNSDYINWPVDQGAPVQHDSLGNVVTDASGYPVPEMFGDQMLWAVFNDADPAQHNNASGETLPLGLEVRQSTFAFDREGSLGNIIIVRLRVYNRGGNTLQNTYFSIWADPDLGGAGDDLVGCDTTLGLGYIYNATNSDQNYGATPPCLAFDFFQGPLVQTGDPADTARMWGQIYEGYKNMNMTSFNKYINGTDPDNFGETYNYMRGLNRDGTPYVYNGNTLLFQCSGDPVEGTGDLDIAPADRRFMMSTGPITFRPNDSLEILAALIVGQGSDRLSSITVMKDLDNFAQKLYENGFNPPNPPTKPVVTVARESDEITLSWTDTSEVDPGDFTFEGYSVWQGPSSSGPWTLMKTFDVKNARTDALIDSLPLTGTSIVMPVVKRLISNSGLRYNYTISKNQLTGEAIFPVQTYYFRVSAFSFDYIAPNGDVVPNGDRFLESQTTVTVTPQAPLAGVHPEVSAFDTLTATHTGGSDGTAYPLVIDPLALTGDTYRVIFKDDPSLGIVWDLIDVTTGQVLLADQTNQSGDDAYQTVDGIMVKVSGPAPGFKSFEVVANGDGVLDPPEGGAFDFGDFPSERPTDRQQVGAGLWGIHTADNGGSCDGGTRCCYDAFLSRVLRDGSNDAALGVYDFEMRFTGSNANPGVNGSYAVEAFTDDNVFWVPFELWNIGVGTPDDPSDDFRMLPFVIDDGNDNTFNLESWGCDTTANFGGDGEHSVSGGDNDPFTDWVYWYNPTDESPGEAGYLANEADMLAGTYDYSLAGDEVMARMVLVSWNGGTEPPFTQDLPEQGTVFRMTTFKPNAVSDTFTFVAPGPTYTHSQADLDAIKAVPNPFYLVGPYDPAPGSYQLKWHHLPEKCTITIYNLAGELVRTIHKDDPSTAIASWDLLTERGLPIASGIYIYVVDAPGYGQKIGKVAVFVESEVLNIY